MSENPTTPEPTNPQWQQQPPAPGGYMPMAPPHPQATTVLVLGILGLVVCQILGPFAWSMGNRVVREIDASGGAMSGRENANIGKILGIIATALLGLTLLFVIFAIVVPLIFGVASSNVG